MHFQPLQVAMTLANLLLGLAVAASGAFLYGRSRSAAAFFGVAGLAFMLGELAQVVAAPMWSHLGSQVMQPIMLIVTCGKNLGFFGGMVLGVRAIAVATPARQQRWP
jgi:hypothetical protein